MNTADIAQRFGSGQAVRRLEDDSLLQGKGRYTDDFAPQGQAHLVFLRSPYPHARLLSVDTTAAKAMPGVLAVLTGAALAEAGVPAIPSGVGFARADGKPCGTPLRRLLAHERVRYVGEAVALVVAATLQEARDASEVIAVDYEELPMVADMADALQPGAPALCDEAPDNIAAEMRHGSAADTDAAFAKAAHVVKLDIRNQRVAAVTLEPRSVLAYADPSDGRLTLRMSTQMPSGVRDSVAKLLGLPPEQMRVVVDDVGGGFGMKTGMYPEDAAVAYAARLLARPVKWVAERGEEFLSTSQGRDVRSQAALALDASGKILALRVHGHANVGAYVVILHEIVSKYW